MYVGLTIMLGRSTDFRNQAVEFYFKCSDAGVAHTTVSSPIQKQIYF